MKRDASLPGKPDAAEDALPDGPGGSRERKAAWILKDTSVQKLR